MNAAGPRVTSFCSISFCYNIVEMPRNLMLVYIDSPEIKLVTFYIVLLKITEPIDNIKQELTVQFLHPVDKPLYSTTLSCFPMQHGNFSVL